MEIKLSYCFICSHVTAGVSFFLFSAHKQPMSIMVQTLAVAGFVLMYVCYKLTSYFPLPLSLYIDYVKSYSTEKNAFFSLVFGCTCSKSFFTTNSL